MAMARVVAQVAVAMLAAAAAPSAARMVVGAEDGGAVAVDVAAVAVGKVLAATVQVARVAVPGRGEMSLLAVVAVEEEESEAMIWRVAGARTNSPETCGS